MNGAFEKNPVGGAITCRAHVEGASRARPAAAAHATCQVDARSRHPEVQRGVTIVMSSTTKSFDEATEFLIMLSRADAQARGDITVGVIERQLGSVRAERLSVVFADPTRPNAAAWVLHDADGARAIVIDDRAIPTCECKRGLVADNHHHTCSLASEELIERAFRELGQ